MNFDRLGAITDEETPDGQLLDGELSDEFGFSGEGRSRRRVGEATFVIVGSLLVAAATLYGMRWLGTKVGPAQSDVALEAKVNAFLESVLGSKKIVDEAKQAELDPDQIMKRLADDRTEKQVPLGDVKKNPFLRSEDLPGMADLGDQNPLEDPIEAQRRRMAERYAALEEIAQGMYISAIGGRKGNRTAIIEGEVVQNGDEIGIDEDTLFKVVRINSFDVILEIEGFQFIVTMAH